MYDGYYPFKNSSVHFSHWGTGKTLLIGLHGYGESAAKFTFLGEALTTEYTLLAIDFPFHGSTQWKEGLSFTPEQLLLILDGLTEQLGMTGRDWWLLGYSMGGRVALSLFEKIPERVARLILIAPDGLTVNSWYWLATQTRVGNRIFRTTMRRPGWFFLLLRIAEKLRLVNPSVYKFATHYIADDQVRQNLYVRWTTMREFRPQLSVIRDAINTRAVPVRLLYGRYDRIIRWENGERFQRGIGENVRMVLLPSGHHLLQLPHLAAIQAAFTS